MTNMTNIEQSDIIKAKAEKPPDDVDIKSEEKEDKLTPFTSLLLSLIRSTHMLDHHPDDEDMVVEAAKKHLQDQLLTFGCQTDDDFDQAFTETIGEYCGWFRELGYITSDYYDEAIDIDGYQINLLEVNDVILSQETRTLLEQEREKLEPNYFGEFEAGPYRGNLEGSVEWEETRKKREIEARQGLMDTSVSMVEYLVPHIDTKGYCHNK